MTSPTDWSAVDKWARAEIEDARDKLEHQRDPLDAAATRGRIAALRDLIAIGQPAEPPPRATPPIDSVRLTGGPKSYV